MPYVILVLLLMAVVWMVSAPLRHRPAGDSREDSQEAAATMRRIDLEAARDAKYREIRDAELDHQTGKLSDQDFEAIDSTLRTEAIAVLHELDELEEPQEVPQDVG